MYICEVCVSLSPNSRPDRNQSRESRVLVIQRCNISSLTAALPHLPRPRAVLPNWLADSALGHAHHRSALVVYFVLSLNWTTDRRPGLDWAVIIGRKQDMRFLASEPRGRVVVREYRTGARLPYPSSRRDRARPLVKASRKRCQQSEGQRPEKVAGRLSVRQAMDRGRTTGERSERSDGVIGNNRLRKHTMLTTTVECPPIFSQVWVREPHKQVWAKAFLLLKDKNLYLSYKVSVNHLLVEE
ncbi:SH3/SH2 adaptor activity protein [Homalodisca vitripennis]|nr:SH3/SH2 adaptor activity protein [Homalodisca vitripennis]